jgi:hypothetical protein
MAKKQVFIKDDPVKQECAYIDISDFIGCLLSAFPIHSYSVGNSTICYWIVCPIG